MNSQNMIAEDLEVDAVLWSPKKGPARFTDMREVMEACQLGLTEKVTSRGNGSWLVLSEQTGCYIIRLSRPLRRPIVEPNPAAVSAVAIGG